MAVEAFVFEGNDSDDNRGFIIQRAVEALVLEGNDSVTNLELNTL